VTDHYRKDPEAVSRLTPQQYRVTHKNGTEPPFSNDYRDNNEPGIHVDVVSGEPLLASASKSGSHTGWPGFTTPIEPGNVATRRDFRMLIPSTEVRSAHGGSHLGHPFHDGPKEAEACATASTPPPCASSRPATWNAKATAPTATFSSTRRRHRHLTTSKAIPAQPAPAPASRGYQTPARPRRPPPILTFTN
jgi:methionine-R-sulfoxide reductase